MKHKKIKKHFKHSSLAMSLFLAFSHIAHAQVTAQSGFYIQGQGSTTIFQNHPDTHSTSSKDNLWGYGFGVGYLHALDPNFLAGLELNYANLGSYQYNSITNNEGANTNTFQVFRNYGYEVLLQGKWLAPSGFNVFIKGGAADANTKAVYNDGTVYGSQKKNRWVPVAAIGFGYMPSQNLDFFAQYKHYFGSNWENVQPTVNGTNLSYNFPSRTMQLNVISLGVAFNFPAR